MPGKSLLDWPTTDGTTSRRSRLCTARRRPASRRTSLRSVARWTASSILPCVPRLDFSHTAATLSFTPRTIHKKVAASANLIRRPIIVGATQSGKTSVIKRTDNRSAGIKVRKQIERDSGIGARIRFLRQQRNMTLEQLSASSGLTKSFVSKIERGVSVPSISTAMRLAQSFKVTVSQLLGEDHYDDALSLVRKEERRSFMRPGSSSGYNYEMIAGPKRFKRMEPYIMRPPLKFQNRRLFEHLGEEFMFVLSGKVEVEISGQILELRPGDALYFDSHLPHRSRSLGGRYAEVLVVVTEM